MKMKVSTRIILTIYLIVIILFCAFMLLTMFNVIPQDNLVLAVRTILEGGVGYKILYVIIFAALIVFGFILMFFGPGKKSKTATVSTFENGKIQISVNAIVQLTKKYLSEYENLKEEKINVIFKKDTANLYLNLTAVSGTDIPAVTDMLQKGLSEYIFSHAGIKLNNIKILISSISEEKPTLK